MTSRRWAGRIRVWLAALFLVLALLPSGALAAPCDGAVYGTGGDGVWLRAAPSLDADRLVLLGEGTPFTLLEGPKRNGGDLFWARIEVDGQDGWMVAEYLLMNGSPPPMNTVPTTDSAPPPTVQPVAAPAGLQPGGWAQVTGTFPADGLRLRAAASPAETLLAILPEGSTLQLVEGPIVGTNGDPWYRVNAAGQDGWVDSIYLVATAAPPTAAPTPQPADLGPGGWAQVTGTYPADGLRLRTGASPTETLLQVLAEGSKVQIVGGPRLGDNGDLWYHVNADGTQGWVDGIYLVATSAPVVAAPVPATGAGAKLVKAALAQVGKKYAWSGVGPDVFDCSGLVWYAARAALGVDLPRIAADQAFAGVHVDRDQLAPGDLVFFANTYAPGITHVGVYIGGNRWVTAQDEQTGVVVLTLDIPYWKARYAGARRIT